MTKEEFEVCRVDPYRAFHASQQRIAELQQRVSVAKKLNAALLQDPQYQFGQAVQNFEKLKDDHIQLNDAYNDLEAVHESLQEVAEVLRGDKHKLLSEINGLRREISIQGFQNAELEQRTRQLRAFNDHLDLKIKAQEAQLAKLDDDVKDSSKQLVQLESEVSALESTCQNLSLQSGSLSDLRQHLDTTRVSQDRAIQALEREVQGKAQEIVQHDTQLWEFKREMSGRILALQKKAQECFDELSRLHRLSEHEMGTLAAQNRALNDELKSTADALFATRKEKTDFSQAAKKEITQRKEEIQQCLSILDLVERQNAGLEASISRMIEQNKLSEKQIAEKDSINQKNLIEQANFLSLVHMELQTTREDLYLLKARLCHHCREVILADEMEEDRRDNYMQGGQQQSQQPQIKQSPGGTQRQESYMDRTNQSLQPMEFDASGGPVIPAGLNDPEKQRMEAELKRTREALEALNRQLLEERSNRDRERREEEEQRQLEETDREARHMEEEARRLRAREDDRKLAAGEEAKTFIIRFMDGTRKKIDAFLSDTVNEIIQRVCSKIGVRQSEFFFLAHSVNENSVLGAVDRFLDKHKTLEQENITPKCNLVFKFKHYKLHKRWGDIVAQEWMFRQIHQNVITEYYPVTEKLAVELASYEIQSVFGDHSGKKMHSYFDRVALDAYLPVSVSAHLHEYWQERLYDMHKMRKGLSTIEARNRYIQTFQQKSPLWGMTFFDVRDRENRPFLAGIAEDGLYILSTSKRDILAALRFDQLLGWERSPTGIFVKKRGSTKMTLYASSKLQSKEMVDLLNEYYMMLPQTTRDRFGIAIDNAEELRARLPPPETFENPKPVRERPVEFGSRLEYMKSAYMEHFLQQTDGDQTRRPITKFTQAIDYALDHDKDLEELDLSNCDPPLDDHQLAVIHELLNHTLDRYTPQDMSQWKENIVIKKISLFHERDRQHLTERSIGNICDFIRKFSSRLTHVDLSFIPLDNKNEHELASALVNCADLEGLVLKGCRVGPKGFQFILNVFGVVPSRLKVLNMEQNSLTHASVNQLCQIMDDDNCSLTNLNLGYNSVEGTGLTTLIATLKRRKLLKVLDFSRNVGGKDPKQLATLISSSVGITDLSITNNELNGTECINLMLEIKNKGELLRLDMSRNPIGSSFVQKRQVGSGVMMEDHAAQFFSFLDVGSYCNIKELIMDGCSLQEDAAQALASVLHSNTKLTELVLSNNPLAAKTGLLAPAWMDTLPINQYVSTLHLSYCGMTYPGVMKLFTAMRRNRGVKELKLDGNQLGRYPPNTQHAELQTFLENNTTVTNLSMCDMFMKDDVLVKIAEGLKRNRTVKKLNAHNNEITIRGVGEFSRLIGENQTLEFLDLSCKSVQISDELYLQAYKNLIDSSFLHEVLL